MCPNCGSLLAGFELRGIEIDHCPNCGGTWLDFGELEFLRDLEEVPPGGMTLSLARMTSLGRGKGKCPRCRRRLIRAEVFRSPLIRIDACPRRHGYWFDPGELDQFIAQYADDEQKVIARFFAELFQCEIESRKKGE